MKFLVIIIRHWRFVNKITIFDPLLFTDSQAAQDMKDRYRSCFSTQLQNRIVFEPINIYGAGADNNLLGRFKHFVEVLNKKPEQILF